VLLLEVLVQFLAAFAREALDVSALDVMVLDRLVGRVLF
jgi:hypothetical protein